MYIEYEAYYNEAYIHVLYLPTLSNPLLESDFGFIYFTSHTYRFQVIKKNSVIIIILSGAVTIHMTFTFIVSVVFSVIKEVIRKPDHHLLYMKYQM